MEKKKILDRFRLFIFFRIHKFRNQPFNQGPFFGSHYLNEINTKWKKWKIWQYFRITLLFSCLMCLNFFSIFVQWYYGIPVYVMYIHNYIYNFITFFLFSSRFLDIFFSALNWNFVIWFQFRADIFSARNWKKNFGTKQEDTT